MLYMPAVSIRICISSATNGAKQAEGDNWLEWERQMTEEPKRDKPTLEELMVSTLAMTDALAKLMIAKGVFAEALAVILCVDDSEPHIATSKRCGISTAISRLRSATTSRHRRKSPSSSATRVRNEAKVMKWGLVPSWAPDPSMGQRMINARSETLLEKPSFKEAVKKRRCLVPGEWFL